MIKGPPAVVAMPVIGSPGLKAGTPTLAIVAEIPVNDLSGFEAASKELRDAVHAKENGTLLYCFGKNVKENKVVVTELYTNKEANQVQGATDYFKEGGRRQAPFVTGKVSMVVLQTLGNGGAKVQGSKL